MNNIDKKLILDLSLGKISQKAFFEAYSFDLSGISNHVKNLLSSALLTQVPDDVEYPMLLGFIFKVYGHDFKDLLVNLLQQDWHYKHEDIVSIMQDLRYSDFVDVLYLTALKTFKYLHYDDVLGLARKCTWALSAIDTPYAINKLELLAQSPNALIKSYAQKRLAAKG
ncbi:MAG: hypothetical protein V4722_08790 [Bacteroidota bacterium]